MLGPGLGDIGTRSRNAAYRRRSGISRHPWRCLMAIAGAALLFPAAVSAQPASPRNECVACHAKQSDQRLATPAALFAGQDVHRDRAFGCVDCHGGNPQSTEKAGAHDVTRGYKGKPSGVAIVATCARCHSDAELMRRFAPRQRVDQEAEYVTSVHGKRLAAGDPNVATCVSCHGAHGIRLVNDARSPVFPTNVAATCGSCHADPKRMSGYTLDKTTSPLPTNQLALYQTSVHFAALTKENDLSAPTCNDCHGNHGAAPPGVGTVANVCGTCHVVFAQRFQTSVHNEIFDKGCVECHGNHAVLKPSDDMLGTDAHAICATCHTGADDKGALAAASMRGGIDRLKAAIERASVRLAGVKNAGMEMSAQDLALASARSKLTLARTEVHTFEPARLTPVIGDGLKIVSEVDRAADGASAELTFRRRGLLVSLGAILLVVIALGLKIRQVDRRASRP